MLTNCLLKSMSFIAFCDVFRYVSLMQLFHFQQSCNLSEKPFYKVKCS